MSLFHRAADLAHKGAVCGLLSVFGFQVWQIGKNVYQGMNYDNHPQKAYIEALRDAADEDYKNYHKTDHRDWYDKDDNSYLDNAPKPKPELKRYFK
mmetsp:Transcript_10239/g.15721  ORF Transcript_10239/g.15721 Transcript_10239/m.15721 type:complete len:96 (-) Transcript_10239:252-539(-)|eukprot:CAMPEP_0178918610 /NCGR_PEP_ID=MMETSP0786-20121207/13921_1 /TAXON_ID=186022 /ORGANISM="Thalassionema frauenfeldii, Strain CCMP 1798" /LENGTH=95 /DNA_ID=CAMNT_0020592337 /DNA_START=161 /DNA_END=448 /DNA_ORIENTATION=+